MENRGQDKSVHLSYATGVIYWALVVAEAGHIVGPCWTLPRHCRISGNITRALLRNSKRGDEDMYGDQARPPDNPPCSSVNVLVFVLFVHWGPLVLHRCRARDLLDREYSSARNFRGLFVRAISRLDIIQLCKSFALSISY